MTAPLRIALSGFAGTGKSTLARELATRLDLQYIEESFAPLAHAAVAHASAPPADKANALDAYVRGFSDWVNQRTREYKAHERLVADRCEADLLVWWLSAFRSGAANTDDLTEVLLGDLQRKAKLFDLIVLMPFGVPFAGKGTVNEDQLPRIGSQSLHVHDHALIVGLLSRFTAARMIILPSRDMTTAERADLVEQALATPR